MRETGFEEGFVQQPSNQGSGRALEVIGERRLMKWDDGRMVARRPGSERMLEVIPSPQRGVRVVETFRKPGREFAKTGMVASLTAVVLTGMRVLKPLNPLHTVAGYLFVGFSLWHMMQNEKRPR